MEIVAALDKKVKAIHNKGPDLEFEDGTKHRWEPPIQCIACLTDGGAQHRQARQSDFKVAPLARANPNAAAGGTAFSTVMARSPLRYNGVCYRKRGERWNMTFEAR